MSTTVQMAPSLASADASVLLDHLRDEIQSQDELREHLQGLHDLLASSRPDGVLESARALEPIVARVQAVAQRRHRVLGAVFKRLGLDPAQSKLDEVIERAADDVRAELTKSAAVLRNLAAEVRRLNRINNLLIRELDAFNRALLLSLFGSEGEVRTYAEEGSVRAALGCGLVDRRI